MHYLEMLQPRCQHQQLKQNAVHLWELGHRHHSISEQGLNSQACFRPTMQSLVLTLTLPISTSTPMASLEEDGVSLMQTVSEAGLAAWFPERDKKATPHEASTAKLDRMKKIRVQDPPVLLLPPRHNY